MEECEWAAPLVPLSPFYVGSAEMKDFLELNYDQYTKLKEQHHVTMKPVMWKHLSAEASVQP